MLPDIRIESCPTVRDARNQLLVELSQKSPNGLPRWLEPVIQAVFLDLAQEWRISLQAALQERVDGLGQGVRLAITNLLLLVPVAYQAAGMPLPDGFNAVKSLWVGQQPPDTLQALRELAQIPVAPVIKRVESRTAVVLAAERARATAAVLEQQYARLRRFQEELAQKKIRVTPVPDDLPLSQKVELLATNIAAAIEQCHSPTTIRAQLDAAMAAHRAEEERIRTASLQEQRRQLHQIEQSLGLPALKLDERTTLAQQVDQLQARILTGAAQLNTVLLTSQETAHSLQQQLEALKKTSKQADVAVVAASAELLPPEQATALVQERAHALGEQPADVSDDPRWKQALLHLQEIRASLADVCFNISGTNGITDLPDQVLALTEQLARAVDKLVSYQTQLNALIAERSASDVPIDVTVLRSIAQQLNCRSSAQESSPPLNAAEILDAITALQQELTATQQELAAMRVQSSGRDSLPGTRDDFDLFPPLPPECQLITPERNILLRQRRFLSIVATRYFNGELEHVFTIMAESMQRRTLFKPNCQDASVIPIEVRLRIIRLRLEQGIPWKMLNAELQRLYPAYTTPQNYRPRFFPDSMKKLEDRFPAEAQAAGLRPGVETYQVRRECGMMSEHPAIFGLHPALLVIFHSMANGVDQNQIPHLAGLIPRQRLPQPGSPNFNQYLIGLMTLAEGKQYDDGPLRLSTLGNMVIPLILLNQSDYLFLPPTWQNYSPDKLDHPINQIIIALLQSIPPRAAPNAFPPPQADQETRRRLYLRAIAREIFGTEDIQQLQGEPARLRQGLTRLQTLAQQIVADHGNLRPLQDRGFTPAAMGYLLYALEAHLTGQLEAGNPIAPEAPYIQRRRHGQKGDIGRNHREHWQPAAIMQLITAMRIHPRFSASSVYTRHRRMLDQVYQRAEQGLPFDITHMNCIRWLEPWFVYYRQLAES